MNTADDDGETRGKSSGQPFPEQRWPVSKMKKRCIIIPGVLAALLLYMSAINFGEPEVALVHKVALVPEAALVSEVAVESTLPEAFEGKGSVDECVAFVAGEVQRFKESPEISNVDHKYARREGLYLLTVEPHAVCRSREFAEAALKARPPPEKNPFHGLPSYSLVCRITSVFAHRLGNLIFPSMKMFWPEGFGEIALIWDEESKSDRFAAEKLAKEWSRMAEEGKIPKGVPLKIWYEHYPKEPSDIFPGKIRNAGYDRQMYSTYYADLQSDADIIGIIDSDSYFAVPVLPETLYNVTAQTAVNIGRSHGPCGADCWDKGTKEALGRQDVNFMCNFPMNIHRVTFKTARVKVVEHNKRTFSRFEDVHKWLSREIGICQYCVILSAGWMYNHELYEWHVQDDGTNTFPGENVPVVRTTVHKQPQPYTVWLHTCCTLLLDTEKDPATSQLIERSSQLGRELIAKCKVMSQQNFSRFVTHTLLLNFRFESEPLVLWGDKESFTSPDEVWGTYINHLRRSATINPDVLATCMSFLNENHWGVALSGLRATPQLRQAYVIGDRVCGTGACL